MKYLQEVTAWEQSFVQNHVYYVNDDKTKMVGYIKNGSTSLFKFSKPMSFSSRGRKFIEVKSLKPETDDVYFPKEAENKPPKQALVVTGTGGKQYYLTKTKGGSYSCTCTGFSFRRSCKHSEAALAGNLQNK